ncbi:unnamed protein product [Lactuca saligna]|uniref:ubiquitinyl hydrolase 1 n=1 Tax=Lactuca saligna TaxID=75948 RepID=A0AA36DUI6_LACSI|nr:unnamed protein product [Lactuca saligna]
MADLDMGVGAGSSNMAKKQKIVEEADEKAHDTTIKVVEISAQFPFMKSIRTKSHVAYRRRLLENSVCLLSVNGSGQVTTPIMYYSFCSGYVGSLYVRSSQKPTEIVSKLNEKVGFSPDEEIELYEEIKFERHHELEFDPCVMCARLDIKTSFGCSQIKDGDIICFQKVFEAGDKDNKYPNIPSFLEHVYYSQVVHFRSKGKPEEDAFTLELFRPHNVNLNLPECDFPIEYPFEGNLVDMLGTSNEVNVSPPDAELRLLLLYRHRIYKVFRLWERIVFIDDTWVLRAEKIPEEEKDLKPGYRRIHVYHFIKQAQQKWGLQQVKNFGEPFFMIIHEDETLAAIKPRIQCKLVVPDDEFSNGSRRYFRDIPN